MACLEGTGGTSGRDGATGTGGSNEVRPDLCPRSGTVTAPLPDGVAIAYAVPQGDDGISQLLATDSELFWKNQTKIVRVSLSDGSETTVVDYASDTFDHSVTSFAIDDQRIYFSDTATHGGAYLGLATFPLEGSGAATTLVDNAAVGLVAVSDGYVYYEDEVTHGIYQSGIARVPTTGGTPTEIVRGMVGGLHGLAVGGGYVYFMGSIGGDSYSNLYLARIPVTAQAPAADAGATGGASADAGVAPAGSELVATTGLDTNPPVTDATNVYWGDGDQLMMAPLTGGAPVMLAQADPITGLFVETAVVSGITPHGDSVYWSSFGCQALRKTALSGGTTTTVVESVSASLIAVNSTHVYFTPDGAQILSGPL